jgi:uncharacterized protein
MDFTLVFIAACILVGVSKGGLIGPVGGTLALPLLIQTSYGGQPVSTQGAVGVLLVLLLIGDAFAVPMYWKQWDLRFLRVTVPAAVAGVALGTWVLVSLDARTLRHAIGLLTLAVIAYKIGSAGLARWLQSAAYAHQTWHGWLSGLLSGIGSALANTGGPPMTAYLLLQRMTPRAFVATNAVFFLIVNLLKVPPYIATGVFDELHVIAGAWWALPLIPAMIFGSRPIIHRINRAVFDWLITGLLAISAVSLLAG